MNFSSFAIDLDFPSRFFPRKYTDWNQCVAFDTYL